MLDATATIFSSFTCPNAIRDAGHTIASVVNANSYSLLLSDDRDAVGSLAYDARPFKMRMSGEPTKADRAIFVIRRADARDVLMAFPRTARIETVSTPLDSERIRIFCLAAPIRSLSPSLNPQKF